MAQVPFAYEFEWSNGDSATKHLSNYCSAISEKLVQWPNVIQPFDQLYPNVMNGNSVTVLSANCHSGIRVFP